MYSEPSEVVLQRRSCLVCSRESPPSAGHVLSGALHRRSTLQKSLLSSAVPASGSGYIFSE